MSKKFIKTLLLTAMIAGAGIPSEKGYCECKCKYDPASTAAAGWFQWACI